MEYKEIQNIAKLKGLVHVNLFKTELIKAIQTKEGNFDCYSTAHSGKCDQLDCLWREDCFEAACKS
jgi:hypothetical protein